MIALLMSLGVDVVMRQHQRRHTDFRRGQRLGGRDHVVSWTRPARPAWMSKEVYAAMPESLVMREVRVGGWTLVSTLLDARQVSKQELCDPYCRRWQVELDLRAIKTVMQGHLALQEPPDGAEGNRHASAGLQPGARGHGASCPSWAAAAAAIELQSSIAVAQSL